MGKCSILVWNNRKPQINILHDNGCEIPEMSIHQVHEGTTKFCTMLTEVFNESDQINKFPEENKPQHKKEWNNWPRRVVVSNTEDIDSDNKDSAIPPLIYHEDSHDEE